MRSLRFMLAASTAFLTAFAATAKATDSKLTLADYLKQVKTQNPEARAAVEGVASAQLRLNEAEVPYSPEFYAQYNLYDNRALPTNSLSPLEARGRSWEVGVRDTTLYGLQATAFFNSSRSELLGLGIPSIPGVPFTFLTDYEQTAAGLRLTQNLWRNGFGESSRADHEATRAMSRAALYGAQFELKNILLRAENTYWSIVSYNEIIRLQNENVDRAKRLRDHMKSRASMRLFDDVDFMQTEASFQQRELDLATSMNERAVLVRQFNTLRGSTQETTDDLEELPAGEFLLKTAQDPKKRMSREDFRQIYEQAKMAQSRARSAISQIHPQLDLTAGISSNGLDPSAGSAQVQAEKGEHPNWNIGLVFSIPLDYRLIGDMTHAYKAQEQSSQDSLAQAEFIENRTWDDLGKQNREAQDVFERSLTLEKLQADLVRRERQRLLNGRSTTLQTVTIEQNLATSQISRVRAQLALLQIHNLIKQFEEVQ